METDQRIMQKYQTKKYRDSQKVTDVVRGSQELPPSKINTPISVQASWEQTKESCKIIKRQLHRFPKSYRGRLGESGATTDQNRDAHISAS